LIILLEVYVFSEIYSVVVVVVRGKCSNRVGGEKGAN
jgi:hypothetical protein